MDASDPVTAGWKTEKGGEKKRLIAGPPVMNAGTAYQKLMDILSGGRLSAYEYPEAMNGDQQPRASDAKAQATPDIAIST